MSDDPTPPMTHHPEQLLPGYVDGTLEPVERAAVEAHLASCGSCGEEVRYAQAARAALLALPELESPGLAEHGLAALGPTAATAPVDLAERRRTTEWGERWGRVAWSAGVAAAAVIAVVFLFTGGLFDAREPTGAPAAVQTEAGGPATDQALPIVQGGERTPEELDALAKTLASANVLAGPVPTSRAAASEDASGRVGEISACVRQGAALGPEVAPTYLEESTFQGTPIYVGAFLVTPEGGGPAHLELVAVTRDGCQPIYFARRNL